MSEQLELGKTRIVLLNGDITLQSTAAIVNAANSSLMGGGGVDGAIHYAGGSSILEECRKIVSRIGKLDTGKAVITTGGNLQAKYVIHTVGPVWHGGNSGERKLLVSAYTESLKIAVAYRLSSISFPSISTGAYRFPIDEAAGIALDTVVAFISKTPGVLNEIDFVLFDGFTFEAYKKALRGVEKRLTASM
jgi:O-acetyl-ADP-ribose deacetylase (regulator of RNase III)